MDPYNLWFVNMFVCMITIHEYEDDNEYVCDHLMGCFSSFDGDLVVSCVCM